MAKRTLYVPILWAKDGEFGALRQLANEARHSLTPLLEVPPIPWNYAADCPARAIDQHLEKIASKIDKAWGRQSPVLLDFEWINPAERLVDGSHPVTYVFDTARPLGLQLVPVITLARDDAYLTAVAGAVRLDGRGACLRVQPDDLSELDLGSRTRELLRSLRLEATHVDLLIDVRGIERAALDEVIASVSEAVQALPRIEDWRSFVLAGTGFPDTLAGMPQSDVTRVARVEWAFWRRVARQRRLRRIPTFGDYGISSPAPPDVDPRVMKPSASVRYTADDAWVVFKGRNLKDHGYDQFHDVCRRVLRAPEYSGNDFSWGDRYIYDCANRRVSRGNLTTWRKVGTSHHLTFVVEQIATAA